MTAPFQKILHIDDDAVMRMMVKKALERSQMGFEIHSCTTPTEFLETIPNFVPDLLLVDIFMPLMKGPDLLIKARSMSVRTPAIFMTGQEEFSFENRDRLEPILGVIYKPFSTSSLGEDLIRLWQKA